MTAPRDRIMELLADRATGDLTQTEVRELDELLAQMPEFDTEELEMAAAAALVALAGPKEPMPGALRTRTLQTLADAPARGGLRLSGPTQGEPSRPAAQFRSLLAWSGWVAAAACLIIALVLMNRTPSTPAPNSPGRAREQFLAQAPDVKAAPWSDWDNPEITGVTGSVEWSESAQRGFMRFRGLTANDPGVQQYQLWIIDERGLEQRISGGVFDVDRATGEVVVEIEPAVEIHNAAAFAITIERPGGVWVSDMTRRVTIATLQG
ncbi:MAG: anti-sigma factor [Phycisphaeraceae bacterium]|nr:anti-sigma factor [Phycisphaeraceae bacterium]